MDNGELNNLNESYNNDVQNNLESNDVYQNDVQNNLETNDIYQPESSYEYPTYSGAEETQDDSNKKGPMFIIIIILIILILLGLLGYFGYKYFFSKEKEIIIDKISVEGGVLSPDFSEETSIYNVETVNDSVKIVCTYKGKKVNIEGCNKSLLLKDKTSNTTEIKTTGKTYTFNVIKLNDLSPIIKGVTGNDSKDWVKSIILTVDATFKTEPHKEAYSFDGGKTWQEKNTKEILASGEVQILVRDVEENLSAVYTEKVENVDSNGPLFEISVSNKRATITAKDSDSGIVNMEVTKSDKEPTEMKEIDLTKETILKYDATSEGDFYVWAKDKAGNISNKKFIIKTTSSSNSNVNNNSNGNNNSNSNNNDSVAENITISKDFGNATNWTKQVTLKVNASSNKKGTLEYSFDGGSTFSSNNTKTFTANQTVKIVVRNKATGKSQSVTETIKFIDNTNPSCSNITGVSTQWTNDDRTISVTCSDSGSGCKNERVSQTFNKTTKTSVITIYDKVGNKTDCPVNVYIDKTAPTITYETFKNNFNNIYKFQLFVTDNESGINLEEVKYKQKIIKNGIDNIWHKKFNDTKELNSSNGVSYSYRFTKETLGYNYFTISVSDNVGNVAEMEISVKG